jgi:signal peptidase I
MRIGSYVYEIKMAFSLRFWAQSSNLPDAYGGLLQMNSANSSTPQENTLTTKKYRGEAIAILWMLLLIIFVRSVITQPFRIPSGSMIPTLLVGDQLFVAQSSYALGIHIPFVEIDKKLVPVSDPHRGDVIVFRNQHRQNNLDTYYIKRLIGVPGDKIRVTRGQLEINGEKVPQTPVDDEKVVEKLAPDYIARPSIYRLYRERLPGMDHDFWVQRRLTHIQAINDALSSYQLVTGKNCVEISQYTRGEPIDPNNVLLNEICTFEVPADQFFFMGDNRDDSFDGRAWGFVPRDALVGKAAFIWLPRTENPVLSSSKIFNLHRFGLRVL